MAHIYIIYISQNLVHIISYNINIVIHPTRSWPRELIDCVPSPKGISKLSRNLPELMGTLFGAAFRAKCMEKTPPKGDKLGSQAPFLVLVDQAFGHTRRRTHGSNPDASTRLRPHGWHESHDLQSFLGQGDPIRIQRVQAIIAVLLHV